MSFSPSVLLLLLSLYQQSQLRHSALSTSSQSLFVQPSYQKISLEQRAAELETHVPASECFIIEVKIRRTAPPSLGCWHSVATPWLKRVIASQCLVSFQEIFAFMNKKNLRQYIYKVTFHLYSNSNMFVFYIIFIVPVSTGDRNCSIFFRTSSTVLAPSRTKWPTTCMSCSQSP